jgi:hypothetical protein
MADEAIINNLMNMVEDLIGVTGRLEAQVGELSKRLIELESAKGTYGNQVEPADNEWPFDDGQMQ